MVKLKGRRERFCQEYAASGNAYQSAIAAGYSENYAMSGTAKLLGNDRVQKRLQELYNTLNEGLIADGIELKRRLTEVIRGSAIEEVVVTEGIGEGRSEARIVEKRAAVKDQLKAIELLGKMGGMFTTNINVDGDMALNVKVDYGPDDQSEQDI